MALDIVEICASGDHAKFQAILEDETSDVDELLQSQAPDGKSIAEIATIFGYTNIIKELVDRGVDVHSASVRGYTLLHWAACWGQLETLKFLVSSGLPLDACTAHGETARCCASRYNKSDCELYLHKAESFENLKQQVAFYKDFITDPEKNLMRLNKDDKNQGNKACEEKLEWIETNYDIASLQQILDKTSELDSQFHSIIEKVNDTSNAATKAKVPPKR